MNGLYSNLAHLQVVCAVQWLWVYCDAVVYNPLFTASTYRYRLDFLARHFEVGHDTRINSSCHKETSVGINHLTMDDMSSSCSSFFLFFFLQLIVFQLIAKCRCSQTFSKCNTRLHMYNKMNFKDRILCGIEMFVECGHRGRDNDFI